MPAPKISVAFFLFWVGYILSLGYKRRKNYWSSFALACLAPSAQSNSMTGPGFWFCTIIATGLIVAASQSFPQLQIIWIYAILFGMLGVTICG